MGGQKQAGWRAIRGFELYWHAWDNEFVVYHSGSGDTHLLNLLAATALQSLQQAPADLSELTAQIASRHGLEIDEDFQRSMEELVTELARLGLIEQVGE